MNVATFAGRLGRDAETRTTSGGKSVTSFSLAVEMRKSGGEKETLWVDCSLWGDRGERLAQYLTKGSAITVSGEVSARAYTPRGGGEPKAELQLFVRELTLQGGGERSSSGVSQSRSESTNSSAARQSAPPQQHDFDDDIPF